MTDYRFERQARQNRRKALYVTVFFHLFLLGGLAIYSSGTDWRELLPQTVKTSLGIETPAPAQDVAGQQELPRP